MIHATMHMQKEEQTANGPQERQNTETRQSVYSFPQVQVQRAVAGQARTTTKPRHLNKESFAAQVINFQGATAMAKAKANLKVLEQQASRKEKKCMSTLAIYDTGATQHTFNNFNLAD